MSTPFAEALREARERRGLKKAQLARAMGITGPAISQWESGATLPEMPRFKQLVELLDLDIENEVFAKYLFATAHPARNEILQGWYSNSSPMTQARLEKLKPDSEFSMEPLDRLPPPTKTSMAGDVFRAEAAKVPSYKSIQGLSRDVPVYGIAVGGEDGDFQFNGTESDRVTRPTGLANARDIFALYVVNDSMYPAWREGSLFYVNPHRPPVIGDDVVVEMKPQIEGEAGAAFLKRLKARRGNTIVVEQFNPPKEIEFDRDAVRLYRVIPWEEALGLS